MFGLINQVGPLGWPLIIVVLLVVVLFVKNAVVLFGKNPNPNADIEGIKFLGTLGLALGSLSTILGIYQGLQIFSHLTSAQVANGLSLALPAFMFGLIIFIFASILWFVLHLRVKKLQSLSD